MEVAMELAKRMIQAADNGEIKCEDDCCLLIYSMVRDCAYKIRRTVEQESATCGQHKVIKMANRKAAPVSFTVGWVFPTIQSLPIAISWPHCR